MGSRGWAVVAGRELRDLWLGGRGLVLLFAFSVLASVITYLGATSEGINFLEKRETVNLTLQVAVMFGALLALMVAADAISGERERGTLESLLLTPAPRRDLVSGKLLAALSVWAAALVVTVPYVWFLGEPLRAACAVRADAAARRRKAGLGRRAAAAGEPDDGGGALHAQRRDQPVRLDEGARLAHLPDRGQRGARRRGGAGGAAVHVAARGHGGMSSVRVGVLVIVLVVSLALAPVARGEVGVSISRQEVSTNLGDEFGFTTEVRNRGDAPATGLVAHLNVVGLSSGIYVDPEDWSEERTKNVPTLGPGETTSISWSVKAVTGGHAAVYVVVLPEDPGEGVPVSSPSIDVQIADTKDLNSDGVLPLALGVPALIGMLSLAVRRRRA
jgi:type II secretory pathway pseudopilin PulG